MSLAGSCYPTLRQRLRPESNRVQRASDARPWSPPGRRLQSPRQESNLDEWLRRPQPGIHQDEEQTRPSKRARYREIEIGRSRDRDRDIERSKRGPPEDGVPGTPCRRAAPNLAWGRLGAERRGGPEVPHRGDRRSPTGMTGGPHKLRGPVYDVMGQDAGAHIVSDVRAGTHAERDIARARSPQYGAQSSGRSPSSRRIGGTTGRVSGLSGLLSSFIPASSGVRLPLRSLQA